MANGCAAWLARNFREVLKKDVETLKVELNAIVDSEKRARALAALADLSSAVGLEA